MKNIIIFTSVTLGIILGLSQSVQASSGFQAGRIIDDGVFTNKSTMSVSQIQTFLNNKVPNCDTNGQQLSEFGGPDLNGDGKVQRWEWGKQKYNQTTFPCLKDYAVDGISAAQLIHNAAQTYSINPQVLIVLLQKEQGLVTDTWPLNIQYRSATGYGCPDTAACDSKYYGLKNQLNWAATMFRAIMDDSPTWYTPYEVGNNYIQYNPNASCGGSTVNIQNRSTQALYNYTPYQPNQAALEASMGQTVTCGAYGNINFYRYFVSWFGDPNLVVVGVIAEGYKSNTWLDKPLINAVCELRDGGCYQLFKNGAIYWSQATGAQVVRGGIKDKWVSAGFENGALGYPATGELVATDGSAYQKFQGGIINWASAYGGRSFTNDIFTKWNESNGQIGFFGRPTTDSLCGLKNNGCYQLFRTGSIYWTTATGAQTVHGGIKDKWVKSGTENGILGYPTSGEVSAPGGVHQTFENGLIFWSAGSGAIRFTNDLYATWTTHGAEKGFFGKPTTDSLCGLKNNGCYQLFKTSSLYWTAETGAQSVHGGIKEKWMSVGLENGALGYPTSGEIASGAGVYQTFQGGTINWTPSSGASIVYN